MLPPQGHLGKSSIYNMENSSIIMREMDRERKRDTEKRERDKDRMV